MTGISGLLFYGGIIFIGIYLGDMLFEYEYRKHYPQWIADGSPCGIFWKPAKGTVSSISAGKKLLSSWFLSTPDWIKRDKHAKLLLTLDRILFVIGMSLAIYWEIIRRL